MANESQSFAEEWDGKSPLPGRTPEQQEEIRQLRADLERLEAKEADSFERRLEMALRSSFSLDRNSKRRAIAAITTAHEAAIKEEGRRAYKQGWDSAGGEFGPEALKEARLRELKALLDPAQEYVEKSTVLARIAELGELNK